MKELTCLIIFIAVSAMLSALMVLAGFICQYKKKSAVKDSAYECGIQTFSDAKFKFEIRYFNYAVLFLIFDIETIFLYPFAVYMNILGIFCVIEAFLFVAILLLGLYIAINKKFLRWL